MPGNDARILIHVTHVDVLLGRGRCAPVAVPGAGGAAGVDRPDAMPDV